MKDIKWFEDMEERIPTRRGAHPVRARAPTGYMHVGNLRTALYTYLHRPPHIAASSFSASRTPIRGVSLRARLTLFTGRCAQCGLEHDEGPDVGGPVGPYVQTERRGLYKEYAELLMERGHAYRCFCEKTASEEDSGDFDPQGRSLPLHRAVEEVATVSPPRADPMSSARRSRTRATTTFHDEIFGDITVENASLDDQVLIKRDGLPTYNFANVIDDHLMGITHVVRGSEYLSSAPKYNLLYEGFGWDIPKYVHCSPVMRDAHNKMSKRHGDPSYEDLIAQGYLTEAVVNYVALLGWTPARRAGDYSACDELVGDRSTYAGISKSPAIFDIDKLTLLQQRVYPRHEPRGVCHARPSRISARAVKNPALRRRRSSPPLLQQRTEVLTDIPGEGRLLRRRCPSTTPRSMSTRSPNPIRTAPRTCSKRCIPIFEALPAWDDEHIMGAMVGLAEAMEAKNAKVMWPVRIAAAGKAVTPGGAVEICRILGKDETLRRLNVAIEKLG